MTSIGRMGRGGGRTSEIFSSHSYLSIRKKSNMDTDGDIIASPIADRNIEKLYIRCHHLTFLKAISENKVR